KVSPGVTESAGWSTDETPAESDAASDGGLEPVRSGPEPPHADAAKASESERTGRRNAQRRGPENIHPEVGAPIHPALFTSRSDSTADHVTHRLPAGGPERSSGRRERLRHRA